MNTESTGTFTLRTGLTMQSLNMMLIGNNKGGDRSMIRLPSASLDVDETMKPVLQVYKDDDITKYQEFVRSLNRQSALGSLEQALRQKHSVVHSCRRALRSGLVAEGEQQQMLPIAKRQQRSVRFGDVRVREYGVTVGAYAAANDSCPLQLTWEHAPHETCLSVEEHQTAGKSDKSLRRLSTNTRRARIARVQGASSQTISRLELDLALELIQETLQSMNEIRRRNSKVTHTSTQTLLQPSR
jgi:hypothetical protein